jgi:hypothetical protein
MAAWALARPPEGLERTRRARLKHGRRSRLFRVQRILSYDEAVALIRREEARQQKIANREARESLRQFREVWPA